MASDHPKGGETRAGLKRRIARTKAGVARVTNQRRRMAAAGELGKGPAARERRRQAYVARNRARRKG